MKRTEEFYHRPRPWTSAEVKAIGRSKAVARGVNGKSPGGRESAAC